MMILMKTVVMRSISLSMWVIDDDRMSWRVSMNWSWIVEWNDNWWEWVELSDFYGRIEIEWWIESVWIMEMNWWWCWYMEYWVWMIYDEWRDNQDSRFELIESVSNCCDWESWFEYVKKRIGLNEWWLDLMTSERVDIIVLFWRNDIDIENQSRLKSLLVR